MNSQLINLFIRLEDDNSSELIAFFLENGAKVNESNFDITGLYYGVIANGFGNVYVRAYSYEELRKLQSSDTQFTVNFVSLKNAKKIVNNISINNIRESGDISESVDNIISINPPRSFPRVMWVKNFEDDTSEYKQQMVIGYDRRKFIAWSNYRKDTLNKPTLNKPTLDEPIEESMRNYSTITWDHAIELDELTVLTKEDIAKLANTTVDKLKIIE